MKKTIKIVGIALIFSLIVSIPPTYPEQVPQENIFLKSGKLVKCDKVWVSSKHIVRCRMGDSEWLYSTDEIDLEKTFGESVARAPAEGRKGSREDKVLYKSEVQESKRGISVTVGVGELSGYTKYQIGGTVHDIFVGKTEVHFPISELDFPLDVYMVSAGVSVQPRENWKFSLDTKKNITSDAGTMKDSDWGVFYLDPEDYPEPMHEFQHNTLDVYSETDADLNAFIIDIELQYRFLKKSNWSLSGGFGYIYQYFAYDVSNLDQWYPSCSYYFGEDLPHDYERGEVLTYEVSWSIPYLEVGAEVKIKDKVSIKGSLGYAPYIHVADKDNHILRSKISKGDLYGDAVMISLEGRYNFTNDWFLLLKFDKTTMDAEGKSRSYSGDFCIYTIDEEIESEQKYTSLSIGYVF